MLFALAFIACFLFALLWYSVRKNWLEATISPLVALLLVVIFGGQGLVERVFFISFGAPLVFFSALLGVYIAKLYGISVKK